MMSAEQSAIAATASLFAASATWIAASGATYSGEGPTTAPATAFAVLDIESGGEFTREGASDWLGSVTVRAEILQPPANSGAQADLTAARTFIGTIRREMLIAAGAALVSLSTEPPIKLEESSVFAGFFSSALTLTFLAIP
jgi:hypothetical protein